MNMETKDLRIFVSQQPQMELDTLAIAVTLIQNTAPTFFQDDQKLRQLNVLLREEAESRRRR